MTHRLWPLAFAACTVRSGNSAPLPQNAPAAKPAPPAAGAPAASDVQWLPDGVVAIGQPRGQIGRDEVLGAIAVSADKKLVLADADGWVAAWDATTGLVRQDLAPENDDDPHGISLAVSPDARWLAVGSSHRVRVLASPFTAVSFKAGCYDALAFSHDSKLLACRKAAPEIWSVADGKQVAPAPSTRTVQAAVFAPDDHGLVFATENEISRWGFAPASPPTSVYKSNERFQRVTFAANGKLAYASVMDKKTFRSSGRLVDLATGAATDLAIGGAGALSASGTRVAIATAKELSVLDTASRQQVWSAKLSAPVKRLAFGSDDMLAYQEGSQLRVARLPAAPIAFDATSRFAGWIDEGIVGIERGTALSRLSLTDRSTGPADRGALAHHAPPGAPAWATWTASGEVAAEANARHAALAGARDRTECAPSLRVWTAAGGTKTLKMVCSHAEDVVDPGWELGPSLVAAITTARAKLFDPKKGTTVATLEVERPEVEKKELEHRLWAGAVGTSLVALLSYGPMLEGGSSDGSRRRESDPDPKCVSSVYTECRHEWLLSLWDTKGNLVWRVPLTPKTDHVGAGEASGPLEIDHAGKHVIAGFEDGEIRVFSTDAAHAMRSVRLHHHRIVRLSVSPRDGWVLSEDASGEQRVWRL